MKRKHSINISYKGDFVKRIYFYGIMRTGIHAISYWIVSNINYYKDSQEYLDKNILVNNIPEIKIQPMPDESKIQLLIHESWDINKDTKFIYDNQECNNKVVIILRDPFNWFASVYQQFEEYKKIRKKEKRYNNNTERTDRVLYQKYMRHVENQKKLWFNYAENFFLNKIDKNIILIKYNQWFLDRSYRDKIANDLGFKNKDKYIDFVSHHGSGSSFDGQSLSGSGRKMDVMGRWNSKPHVAFNVRRWARSDKRVEDYSERIFNYNPYKD
jgi:hypothetical protein